MYSGRTLFSQVMEFIPWTSFDRIVVKYGGDIGVRTLRCTEHFRAMAFAQITYRESLRDIEACLGSQPSKLYGKLAEEIIVNGSVFSHWMQRPASPTATGISKSDGLTPCPSKNTA